MALSHDCSSALPYTTTTTTTTITKSATPTNYGCIRFSGLSIQSIDPYALNSCIARAEIIGQIAIYLLPSRRYFANINHHRNTLSLAYAVDVQPIRSISRRRVSQYAAWSSACSAAFTAVEAIQCELLRHQRSSVITG